jgi:hypothetical protein
MLESLLGSTAMLSLQMYLNYSNLRLHVYDQQVVVLVDLRLAYK